MRSRPVRGTRARLMPMLRAVLSMLSISFVGKRVLIRVKPGRTRTPSMEEPLLSNVRRLMCRLPSFPLASHVRDAYILN